MEVKKSVVGFWEEDKGSFEILDKGKEEKRVVRRSVAYLRIKSLTINYKFVNGISYSNIGKVVTRVVSK